MAPEVLNQKPYGKECDYWSIGVVTFMLLAGQPPFYHEDKFALFQLIMNCKYKFDEQDWAGLSAESRDFVQGLLRLNPKERMNCEQMLEHPWMKLAE